MWPHHIGGELETYYQPKMSNVRRIYLRLIVLLHYRPVPHIPECDRQLAHSCQP